MMGEAVPEGGGRSLGLHPAVFTHETTHTKAAQLVLAETFCTKQSREREGQREWDVKAAYFSPTIIVSDTTLAFFSFSGNLNFPLYCKIHKLLHLLSLANYKPLRACV